MKRENMKKLIFLFRKIVFVNITGSSHVATKVFNIGVLRSEISSEIFSVLEQRQYKTDAMDANNWLFKKKCRAFHSFTMREKRAISKLADIFVLSSRSYIVLALPSVSNSKHEPDRQNWDRDPDPDLHQKMIGDPDLDRSFTIADLLSDLFNQHIGHIGSFSSQIGGYFWR